MQRERENEQWKNEKRQLLESLGVHEGDAFSPVEFKSGWEF